MIIYTTYSKTSKMDNKNVDLTSELHHMQKKIDYYKSKLQICRDKYERVETEIYSVRQLHHKGLFILDNVQIEKELRERLQNIHLSYEICIKKSGGYEDLDKTIRTKINELTTQRNILMKELTQLKKNADDNNKKLLQVNAMIKEQEEKNAILLRELQEKSGNITFIPQNIKERLDTTLENLKIDKDNNTNNALQ